MNRSTAFVLVLVIRCFIASAQEKESFREKEEFASEVDGLHILRGEGQTRFHTYATPKLLQSTGGLNKIPASLSTSSKPSERIPYSEASLHSMDNEESYLETEDTQCDEEYMGIGNYVENMDDEMIVGIDKVDLYTDVTDEDLTGSASSMKRQAQQNYRPLARAPPGFYGYQNAYNRHSPHAYDWNDDNLQDVVISNDEESVFAAGKM